MMLLEHDRKRERERDKRRAGSRQEEEERENKREFHWRIKSYPEGDPEEVKMIREEL